MEEVARRQAAYAQRQRPPQSALLSHVTSEQHSRDNNDSFDAGDGGTRTPALDGVRWLRDFATVLNNVYGLPIDESVSSTTHEGRLLKEEGVWTVPTTGNYLISVLLARSSDESTRCKDESPKNDEALPRAVLFFDGTSIYSGNQEDGNHTDRMHLEWRFPQQRALLDPVDDVHPQEWMRNQTADPHNANTNWLAVDAQHKRRVEKLRSYVNAETARRARYGKQHFHFVRVGQMLDANFERNKGKLSEMEIIEQERQDKLAASRQVSPSPAEFFARVFRLRKGVRMYIGLEGGIDSRLHAVIVSSVMLGDLSSFTTLKNGREMPFATVVSSKPFGCFKTAKRFATGEQLFQHMRAKGYHRSRDKEDPPAPVEPSFQCSLCGKSFSTETTLKSHLATKRHVSCSKCGKRFLNDQGLNQHMKNKHERDRILLKHGRLQYPPWPSKAPNYVWKRPKFCCEKESCGRSFMTTEQLEAHHRGVKHTKCIDQSCPQKFHKKTDMYKHYKDKHDIAIYKQGLVERLQTKLNQVNFRLKREKFGVLRWAAKKERLEVKLARALGMSVDEYRATLADKPLVTEGAQMKKSPTSHSVINIVPPREMWDLMQKIRTIHVSDARCGPHISFVEPFVMPEHYPEAAKLLREVMSKVTPFEITLQKVGVLRHEKSSTIILSPEPRDGSIQYVLEQILEIFPQCSDLLSRGWYSRGKFHVSTTLNFIPHVSLRKVPHDYPLDELEWHYSELFEKNPIKFLFKELYILNRIKGDPFEVAHIIPLGPPDLHTQPYFGPGSPGSFGTPEESSALGRSVLLGGIPQKLQESVVVSVFHLMDLQPKDVEVVKNPDGARRSCAVVEFATVEDTRKAIEGFDEFVIRKEKDLEGLGMQPSSLYIRHMPNMVFPGPPGDCCSLRHIKPHEFEPPQTVDD